MRNGGEGGAPTRDAEVADEPPRRARGEAAYWVATVVGLVALTTWLYGPHVFDANWILNKPDADWAQEVWFLAWPAYAVRHGLNPLFSTWQNYPAGLNLMGNTSMPLLGLVLAPVTWLLGPTVAYSVALRLGMLTSACATQWVARRLGLSRVASTLAGLLYACSAMEIVEGNGHVFLTFVPLPPLIGYAVFRAATGAMRPRRAGIVVGLLVGAQALLSLEVALMTVVACAVALVTAALVAWRDARRRARDLAVGAGWLLGALCVVLALPLATYFGRGHFWGPSHPTLEIYRANLLSFVVPGRLTWLSPVGVHLPHALAYRRENGAYLGLPVLAVVVTVAVRWWRLTLVRVATVTTVVLCVLALGTRLEVTSSSTAVPLPFDALSTLPFFDSLSPVRFFILIGLLVALLCGFALDRATAWARRRPPHAGRGGRTALVAAGAACVVASLLPARAYATSSFDAPTWLTGAQGHALVPNGAVVLFYPYPSVADSRALLDQAVEGFRYRLVGGQGVVATAKPNVHAVVPLAPLLLPSVFLRYSTGALAEPPVATIFGLPPLPALDARTEAAFRTFVRRNGVTTVVVSDEDAFGAAGVVRYLVGAFGAPTRVTGTTALVWPDVERATATPRR